MIINSSKTKYSDRKTLKNKRFLPIAARSVGEKKILEKQNGGFCAGRIRGFPDATFQTEPFLKTEY